MFGYYAPGGSVYHEVELDDVSDQREEDSKVCAKKITVGARLNIADLVKAQIQFTKEHCTIEHADPKMATAGSEVRPRQVTPVRPLPMVNPLSEKMALL